MSVPSTACIPFSTHSSIRPSMSLASGKDATSLRNNILKDAQLETLAFASYGYQVKDTMLKLICIIVAMTTVVTKSGRMFENMNSCILRRKVHLHKG